ncbi:MAG: hypothetical protein HON57_08535 [Flavobacteriaceae bacterium]|nr:hypothetical protein [Candidatus Arcticimaribacter sp.]
MLRYYFLYFEVRLDPKGLLTIYHLLINTIHHTTLISLAINTIETIGGGSARCMIAEIFLHFR